MQVWFVLVIYRECCIYVIKVNYKTKGFCHERKILSTTCSISNTESHCESGER